MELTNEFRVAAPEDTVWQALTDVERIAPCMPGAELQSVEGDEYKGVVKVKVGPITAQYKGAARFSSRDDATHRAVLEAEGRETRGQGNASATITAQLTPDGDGTTVSVVTDLKVSGRVAQFGRGVLADVSGKLIDQFADCLADKLAGPGPGGGSGASEGQAAGDGGAAAAESGQPAASSTEPVEPAKPVEPVDLLGTAGAPVAKRLIPIGVVVTTALWLLSVFLRRRRR
jgi:carbon monoxide dehydrogenase subunit G